MGRKRDREGLAVVFPPYWGLEQLWSKMDQKLELYHVRSTLEKFVSVRSIGIRFSVRGLTIVQCYSVERPC